MSGRVGEGCIAGYVGDRVVDRFGCLVVVEVFKPALGRAGEELARGEPEALCDHPPVRVMVGAEEPWLPVGRFDADSGGDSGELGVVGDALEVVSGCVGCFESAGFFVGEFDLE